MPADPGCPVCVGNTAPVSPEELLLGCARHRQAFPAAGDFALRRRPAYALAQQIDMADAADRRGRRIAGEPAGQARGRDPAGQCDFRPLLQGGLQWPIRMLLDKTGDFPHRRPVAVAPIQREQQGIALERAADPADRPPCPGELTAPDRGKRLSDGIGPPLRRLGLTRRGREGYRGQDGKQAGDEAAARRNREERAAGHRTSSFMPSTSISATGRCLMAADGRYRVAQNILDCRPGRKRDVQGFDGCPDHAVR